MFKFLLKNKRGFTIVELIIVLLLLSVGVFAMANMMKVTYRAFQKSEERSIKQEAVKVVADKLQRGSASVCAAQTADIFNTIDVVPVVGSDDNSYSYLYSLPHYPCTECGETWNTASNKCNTNISAGNNNCKGTKGSLDGYYVCIQDKGQNRDSAKMLSDVPIYLKIKAYKETDGTYYSGVTVTIAALEDDFKYEKVDESGNVVKDANGNVELNEPTSDDIYYSLDVAYHFPNMATNKSGVTVNHIAKGVIATAPLYGSNGRVLSGEPVEASDEGIVLRAYCDSIIGADVTNAEATLPTLCFIATASYGHDSGEVGLLCKFRDECLLTNPLGTAFVNTYYKLSPPVAEFISDREPLKAAVRIALKPLVAIATNALDEEAAAENAPWFIVFMISGAAATATLIKVDKRRKKIKE